MKCKLIEIKNNINVFSNLKIKSITGKINIILKNKKYDPINGIMEKEEDVKTLQEFLLGL